MQIVWWFGLFSPWSWGVRGWVQRQIECDWSEHGASWIQVARKAPDALVTVKKLINSRLESLSPCICVVWLWRQASAGDLKDASHVLSASSRVDSSLSAGMVLDFIDKKGQDSPWASPDGLHEIWPPFSCLKIHISKFSEKTIGSRKWRTQSYVLYRPVIYFMKRKKKKKKN